MDERQTSRGSARQVCREESAYGFRNVRPLTRSEKRASKDKVALERQRLFNRAGNAARQYRDNMPPEGVSLTEAQPGAAGYIADADRFHSDVAGEELLRRKAVRDRKVQVTEVLREQRKEQEKKRWETMKTKEFDEELHWTQLREAGVKGKKNESAVPYNMISLRYDQSYEGEMLRLSDERTKYRAKMRSNALVRVGDTLCGYNILSGAPKPPPADPAPPVASEKLQAMSKYHAPAHY
ncbi:unnamed protein product [Chrysoparadoxa australica]